MNPKDKKTIGFNVPMDYPFKGADVKKEVDQFFEWLWQNGGRDMIKQYPGYEKIREVLTKW
jgi:hypothetical protein